jgi:glycosyltransferase involved in cell wall biosynthesis
MNICIFYQLYDGPWGGGNQFLKALKKSFITNGHTVTDRIDGNIDIFLFNSWTIDINLLKELKQRLPHVIKVHRLDGIPTLYGRSIDDQNYAIMVNQLADFTIFQSQWASESFFDVGLNRNIRYEIIYNGVDTDIFNDKGHKKWNGQEPLKIITTSWSNNPRKGFPCYQKLDQLIENRKDIAFTFVGRLPEGFKFEHSKYLQPQNSVSLAGILHDHHIFFQASENDACSNSALEAMNCGLPVMYHNSGGNPEICQERRYGMPMSSDIIGGVEDMKKSYNQIVQNLSDNPYKIKIVSKKYLECFSNLLLK